jgi:hypothetical protein
LLAETLQQWRFYHPRKATGKIRLPIKAYKSIIKNGYIKKKMIIRNNTPN